VIEAIACEMQTPELYLRRGTIHALRFEPNAALNSVLPGRRFRRQAGGGTCGHDGGDADGGERRREISKVVSRICTFSPEPTPSRFGLDPERDN
jgi:hypothetical protein